MSMEQPRKIQVSILTNPGNNLQKSVYQLWQIQQLISTFFKLLVKLLRIQQFNSTLTRRGCMNSASFCATSVNSKQEQWLTDLVARQWSDVGPIKLNFPKVRKREGRGKNPFQSFGNRKGMRRNPFQEREFRLVQPIACHSLKVLYEHIQCY